MIRSTLKSLHWIGRAHMEKRWLRTKMASSRICIRNSLRTLEISLYGGDKYPSWMSSNHLPHLVELKLCFLYRVVELPPLGHLPSLEHLHLHNLKNVRCIGDGFYGTGADAFPCLKILELSVMRSLEEWKESDRHKKDGISTCFPSLERLQIKNCFALRSMPRHLPSCLEKMEIYITALEALPEIGTSSAGTDDRPEYCCDNIPCLQVLTIFECTSLRLEEWFRRHQMPALQKLRLDEVVGCTDLVINYSRKCLTHLKISGITSISEMGGLRSIRMCNMAPLDEFGEAHYPLLSVRLEYLDDLREMSMVNSEDGKITAGPLKINAYVWDGVLRVVENLSEMMLRDEDYSVKNAVEFLKAGVLRVEPRSK